MKLTSEGQEVADKVAAIIEHSGTVKPGAGFLLAVSLIHAVANAAGTEGEMLVLAVTAAASRRLSNATPEGEAIWALGEKIATAIVDAIPGAVRSNEWGRRDAVEPS